MPVMTPVLIRLSRSLLGSSEYYCMIIAIFDAALSTSKDMKIVNQPERQIGEKKKHLHVYGLRIIFSQRNLLLMWIWTLWGASEKLPLFLK